MCRQTRGFPNRLWPAYRHKSTRSPARRLQAPARTRARTPAPRPAPEYPARPSTTPATRSAARASARDWARVRSLRRTARVSSGLPLAPRSAWPARYRRWRSPAFRALRAKDTQGTLRRFPAAETPTGNRPWSADSADRRAGMAQIRRSAALARVRARRKPTRQTGPRSRDRARRVPRTGSWMRQPGARICALRGRCDVNTPVSLNRGQHAALGGVQIM